MHKSYIEITLSEQLKNFKIKYEFFSLNKEDRFPFILFFFLVEMKVDVARNVGIASDRIGHMAQKKRKQKKRIGGIKKLS